MERKRNPGRFRPLARGLRIALPSIRATKNKDKASVTTQDLHYYEPKNGHGLKHDPFNAVSYTHLTLPTIYSV